ncbi:DNA-binding transcriptional regulator, ArsR family [Anaerocolumna jejuensis DSM 15929]|uniref:DNA-binding transcriptional regulator, ArsR family n=1 Tax=Anaerocolumna jejuensis DSM 15929 TaxID=1121322 RepID=A0A1M6PXX5_9FIRM|nr:winged helix-turn-helix domain-containing protein [Anaerocolumna jejuensis]SHK12845.1 DNA-binding transcriptional regulator, ArsR family [Anaerocolumna jejuensis DSM 15929]
MSDYKKCTGQEKYKDCLIGLSEEFKACQKAFTAMGDETRQLIIIALLKSDCQGIRVGEITGRTNLSRPAVSHHIKILMDAGIIGLRRVGTRNYYYIDYSESELKKIEALFAHIRELVTDAPDRRGED